MSAEPRNYVYVEKHIIQNDNLILQEIILENKNNLEESLKPLFDIIYNSSGLPGSYYYDENGKWNGKQHWKDRVGRFG